MQRKTKNDKRIHWQGGIPSNQVFDTIATMDVMIHPTICLEIFGLNIAETLALGIPVIATRCGGAEMQIEDGGNGLLVEPNNATALAQAIQAVVDSKQKFNVNPKRVVSIKEHTEALSKEYSQLSK